MASIQHPLRAKAKALWIERFAKKMAETSLEKYTARFGGLFHARRKA